MKKTKRVVSFAALALATGIKGTGAPVRVVGVGNTVRWLRTALTATLIAYIAERMCNTPGRLNKLKGEVLP